MILEFADDGYSGTTENRPELQRLLTLVHLGKIHGIIVKDLSRFARNYITMGNYLEQVFPLLGVRFISINDGYQAVLRRGQLLNAVMQLRVLPGACGRRVSGVPCMVRCQSFRICSFLARISSERSSFST